jgi:hypothetical protein
VQYVRYVLPRGRAPGICRLDRKQGQRRGLHCVVPEYRGLPQLSLACGGKERKAVSRGPELEIPIKYIEVLSCCVTENTLHVHYEADRLMSFREIIPGICDFSGDDRQCDCTCHAIRRQFCSLSTATANYTVKEQLRNDSHTEPGLDRTLGPASAEHSEGSGRKLGHIYSVGLLSLACGRKQIHLLAVRIPRDGQSPLGSDSEGGTAVQWDTRSAV